MTGRPLVAEDPASAQARPAGGLSGWGWLFAAWLVALVVVLAELFTSEVMGRTVCELCWFQRVFMFPLAVVLGVASLDADRRVWRYALPLAVGGMAVAGFHGLLRLGLIPQRLALCGQDLACSSLETGVLSGPLPPLLTLLAFGAITLLLLLARPRSSA